MIDTKYLTIKKEDLPKHISSPVYSYNRSSNNPHGYNFNHYNDDVIDLIKKTISEASWVEFTTMDGSLIIVTFID